MPFLIVFDVDDTLIETFNYSFNIFQKLRGEPISRAAFLKNYKQKDGFTKNLRYFFPYLKIYEAKNKYKKLKI